MAQAALTIDGLGVDFEGFKAVNGVSLIIEEGSCGFCSVQTAPARPR